jgi:saccharopine dehydrogenase-like NADP-dependent oxidoreductase
MAIERVRVLGLGNVGELVALLLRDAGFDVAGSDLRQRPGIGFPVDVIDVNDDDARADGLRGFDAVVSCLPYDRNQGVAEDAAALGLHYFDLTEDVRTTARVRELAEGASTVFAPQCGLAPGLIAIVGSSLADGLHALRRMQLRVGALPQHPSGMLGYSFTWSPEGVVNEYLNDCEVIRSGQRQFVPAMADIETVVIGGLRLEAFATSGGLGTLCETYDGRIRHLDYKTLRYPGHCDAIRFLLDELGLRDRRELAGEILITAKPPVDDDVVYLYAAVEGEAADGLTRREYVRTWHPRRIAGRWWRAISWTTAASACAVVELVGRGVTPTKGLLRQEDIALQDLLGTRAGRLFADETNGMVDAEVT